MERIRHRSQFNAVLDNPPIVKSPHFALHMADRSALSDPDTLFPLPGTWMGVLLPKRWAKRAVTRNAIRRQIYAVAHELCESLPSQPLVVRLRSGFARDQFVSASSEALRRAVRAELLELLGPRLQTRLARLPARPQDSAHA